MESPCRTCQTFYRSIFHPFWGKIVLKRHEQVPVLECDHSGAAVLDVAVSRDHRCHDFNVIDSICICFTNIAEIHPYLLQCILVVRALSSKSLPDLTISRITMLNCWSLLSGKCLQSLYPNDVAYPHLPMQSCWECRYFFNPRYFFILLF